MPLVVDVLVEPPAADRPPPGTALRVELRDTSVADAPSRLLAGVDAAVTEPDGPRLATVGLPWPQPAEPGTATVWALVDTDADGRVSAGDFVTTRSHPAPAREAPAARVAVTVRRVA